MLMRPPFPCHGVIFYLFYFLIHLAIPKEVPIQNFLQTWGFFGKTPRILGSYLSSFLFHALSIYFLKRSSTKRSVFICVLFLYLSLYLWVRTPPFTSCLIFFLLMFFALHQNIY